MLFLTESCTLLTIAVFYLCRLYKSLWRFASFNELLRVGLAVLLNASIYSILITVLCRNDLPSGRMPASFYQDAGKAVLQDDCFIL